MSCAPGVRLTLSLMLGWLIIVSRTPRGEEPREVARWQAAVHGPRWVDDLLANGTASGGGNGYPMLYRVRAADVRPVVDALPGAMPLHWRREIQINRAALDACEPGEMLEVEAWDLS